MAMSKEQQSEAARLILAKEPLTPEEQRTYEFLKRTPEDYRVPGESRACGRCGAEFQDVAATKDNPGVSALDQFSDHQSIHNPSGAQWSEAHKRIEAGKDRAKQAEKAS